MTKSDQTLAERLRGDDVLVTAWSAIPDPQVADILARCPYEVVTLDMQHGQQTFGVGAKGINTFTGYTAVVFLGSALLLHYLNREAEGGSVLLEGGGGSVLQAPADPGAGGGAGLPAGGGGGQ